MPKLIDLTGLRFNRLVVTGRGQNYKRLVMTKTGPKHKNGEVRWDCACDCGGVTLATTYNLRTGHTQSCGCINRERSSAVARATHATHSLTGSSEYQSWSAMRTRCFNPRAKDYERYGGRGITICDRWNSFENFLGDMGERPSPQHTLDRIDVNGNYESGNCRWATPLEQANNRYDNIILTIDGVDLTLRNAVRRAGSVISISQARKRIRKGWPHSEAVSTPPTR
jgi:hypothetical protein